MGVYLLHERKEFCYHDIFADKGGLQPLYYLDNKEHDSWSEKLNGKVVARFWCDKVVDVVMQMGDPFGYGNNGYVGYGYCEQDNFKFMYDMEEETSLEVDELCKYLNNGKSYRDIYINKLKANSGFAIHISKLEIFDKPKELSEFGQYKKENVFYTQGDGYLDYIVYKQTRIFKKLTKAPQNYCFVESEE